MSPAPDEPAGTGPGLRSDGELREVFVGDPVPHDAPITLAEYDPGWPRLFDREARRIRAALGETPCGPNATWRGGPGGTYSITPTPRPW